MALYTSYYARQLAIRPENLTGDQQEDDGDKKIQKAVVKRTVDWTTPYLLMFDQQASVHRPKDAHGLFPTPAASLDLLPPISYSHKPVTSACVKFAGQAPTKTKSSVNAACWMPDSRRCLTATQMGEFAMWGVQSFTFETIIQAHDSPIRTIKFSHSGNILFSGDDAGNVRFWRPNLELIRSMPAHKESIRQLALSPSDLKFATASDDSTIRVWDFAKAQTEHVLIGHGGDVKCVDWHPTNSMLVSGSKDGLIKLWCARSGQCVATIHGHKGTITATEFNSNGNWVLTSSRDAMAKVFDIRMQRHGPLASVGCSSEATCASWHPIHEEMFVTGTQEGALAYYLLGKQAPLGEVGMAHEAAVWCATWHPTGHLVCSGGADAAIKFWCRSRPGDPFIEEQEAAQEEYAAAMEADAMAATRLKDGGGAVKTHAPLFHGSGGAIPGISGIPGLGGTAPAAPVDPIAAAAAVAQRLVAQGEKKQQERRQTRKRDRWD